jgi:sulfite exporter TauE/SafE
MQALALGLVWGWLPCGLVYSTLIWSISSGNPLDGALLMLAFGAGTLPNLLTMGLVAGKLAAWLRLLWVRRTAGVLVMGFGIYMLIEASMI